MNPMDLLKQSEPLDFMYDIYRDVNNRHAQNFSPALIYIEFWSFSKK